MSVTAITLSKREWMMRRIGIGVLVLLVLVAVGLAVWEPLLAKPGIAPPARSYDTRIVRDDFGVPHIFGTTDPDVSYGIAYAHAEDDFSTLQDVLAMTRGRLGAISGSDGAKTDFALHLLGARATVERDYMQQPADVRALLDGYAAGLNHYADKHSGELKLRRLFPVDGKDVATGFVLRSPFFFGLDAVLGALAGDKPLPNESAGADPDAPNITPVGPTAAENGSNAFLVAPSRSADGATRLVSNSHQPWRGAVAWYELVVHSKNGWDFAGATFPGVPYPLLGHNRTLGWTNTVNRPDLIDIYKLTLNEGGDQYRFDGAMRPLEATRVWLPVKLWGPFVLPVPQTVYRAVHGPVIVNKQGAFAIRYGGMDQLRMVEQYYRLTKARTLPEWEAVLARQGIPATNFLYGDAAGNIAYFYNAAFPNRRPGYDYGKVLPGDTSAALTPGTVAWGAVPRIVNPPSGFLMNANNTPWQAAGEGSEMDRAAWSPLLGVETDTTNRGTRSLELMGADSSITEADLMAIKYDSGISPQSWAARWFADVRAIDPRGDKALGDAKGLIARWDNNFDGTGSADALALLVLRKGNAWHYQRKVRAEPRDVLAESAAYLTKHFGRIDPPLGTLMRLRQGKVDLPLDGGPDVLRAMALFDEAPDGRLAARHGDSFLMFVAWDRAGRVSSQSIQPFGQAITRPESRHYTDQAALFAAKRLKPVHFDPRSLAGHIERSYRP